MITLVGVYRINKSLGELFEGGHHEALVKVAAVALEAGKTPELKRSVWQDLTAVGTEGKKIRKLADELGMQFSDTVPIYHA